MGPGCRGRFGTVAWVSLCLMFILLVLPGVGAQDEVRVDVYPDDEPETSHPSVVELVDASPGDAYRWTVNVTDEQVVVDLVLHEGFDVDRPRQLVPEVDGEYPGEVRGDVVDRESPRPLFNLTSDEGTGMYGLSLPGPGELNLTLERDVQPPSVSMGPVEEVTHNGFDVATTTDEYAFGALVLHDVDRGEQPTPRLSLEQRFPVIGLDADTAYAFHVRAWDWSGNEATTSMETVTTLPEPTPPVPELTVLSPEPNGTVTSLEDIVVEVRFISEDSPVREGGVSVFFDKAPVPASDVQFEDDRVLFHVEDALDPRSYSVSVEVTNQAGGTAVEQWSFEVEEPARASFPGFVVGAIVFALACALGSRKRGA